MTALKDLTSVLRLEVEDTPVGLVNLIQNPNGDLGGWGWLTPLANSAMAGVFALGNHLKYTRTVAGASNFTSELLPITAGQYAAAVYTQTSVGNAYHKVQFEWYNAAKAFLSATAQSALIAPGAASVNTVAPIVAPAGTAYLKLRIDLYAAGGAAPVGAHSFQFNSAMVAAAATVGALATVRTNLIKNPSFETNTTDWSSSPSVGGPAVLSRQTVPAGQVGAACLRLAQVAGIGACGADHTVINGIQPGKSYALSAYFRSGAAAGRTCWVEVTFQDAAGVSLGSWVGGTITSATGAWTRANVVATAPLGAAKAVPRLLTVWGTGAAENHYYDAVQFEQIAALGAYFDGSSGTAGTVSHAWTGTANNSTSTETDTNLNYVPVPYVNILGPTSEIKVVRPPLDVGTLNAVVREVALDPASATLLRPGKRVRLTALNSTTLAWEILFAGKADRAHVEYDLTRKDALQATIELSAIDTTQDVANQNRTAGVGTIPELPYVLEGAGVPWNCDGSGNQVSVATVVSNVENATALDQIALTRDSVSGYAWITKEGVVTAYTDRTLDYYGNGTATIDEDDYTNIATSFDTDDCINEVLVNYLRFNPSTLETTEIPYGPFQDAASIKQWRAHQQTFRVQGISEAGITAFATAILAANATPVFRVNSVTVPIRDTADITALKALIDQYAKVNVVNTAKAINVTHRVQTITHEITPPAYPGALAKWIMRLDFTGSASVASPVPTPSPSTDVPVADGVWVAPALGNGWTNFGGAFAPVGYMRKNGMVYLKGFIGGGTYGNPIFTLPAGYRPAATNVFSAITDRPTTGAASAGTAHTHLIPALGARVDVQASGVVQVAAAATGAYNNTYQSLSGISFPAEQ